MSWHVDQETVRRYQSGTVDRVGAASLEAHLTGCEQCRGLLAVDQGWLDRGWLAVAGRVEPSRRGLAERALTALGVPSHVARIVAVSPALRLSFVLALMLVLGFAVVAANSGPTGETFRIFLLVAPLLPVAGVAFAYGRLVDPAHELTMACPVDSFRILLLRAVAVLTVASVLGLIAWPLVPAPASIGALAWLLPALALTLSTLALASFFEIWLAAVLVGGGWVGAILLVTFSGEFDFFDPPARSLYAALGAMAAALVALRRHSYSREGGSR